jgi:cellobiose phosphorylase
LLDQSVPFIEGQVIPEGAEDHYGTPQESTQQATVYEHAARAIDRSRRRSTSTRRGRSTAACAWAYTACR